MQNISVHIMKPFSPQLHELHQLLPVSLPDHPAGTLVVPSLKVHVTLLEAALVVVAVAAVPVVSGGHSIRVHAKSPLLQLHVLQWLEPVPLPDQPDCTVSPPSSVQVVAAAFDVEGGAQAISVHAKAPSEQEQELQ